MIGTSVAITSVARLAFLVEAAFRPTARRFRVTAAFRPAARSFLVFAAFSAAARRLRVVAAFRAAALRLRVAAALMPAVDAIGISFWKEPASVYRQARLMPVPHCTGGLREVCG